MNIQELINALLKIKDKSLPIRVDLDNIPYGISGENLWIIGLEVSDKGDLGYELEGEVRLLVSE